VLTLESGSLVGSHVAVLDLVHPERRLRSNAPEESKSGWRLGTVYDETGPGVRGLLRCRFPRTEHCETLNAAAGLVRQEGWDP